MEKLYQKIGWENTPSKKTPLNERNLGKMDEAIDKIDSRLIENDTEYRKLFEETANKNETTEKISNLEQNKVTGKGITFSVSEKGSLQIHFDDGLEVQSD